MQTYSCGRCHGILYGLSGKCPHCGANLGGIICSNCKERISSNDVYCPHCSKKANAGSGSTNTGGGSTNPGGGNACYIATVVYGSCETSEVLTLRNYRDEVLQKSYFGRKFVQAYYRLSPAIADRMKGRESATRFVRLILDRIVIGIERSKQLGNRTR